MLSRITAFRIMTVAWVASLALPALAQNEPARPSYSRMLDIDSLLENHARTLARRYNLNEEQDLYTQAFLRERANAFLDKHRDELFDLIDRLVEVKTGADMSPEELIAWGKRALPLYEEAKALIIQGNNEWRQILNDEQRKTHDEDLLEMYGAFSTTEDQLQRIVTGQMTPEEFRRGPVRQIAGAPQHPVRPAVPIAQPQAPATPERSPRPTAGPAHQGPRPTVSNPVGGIGARPTPGASGAGASGPRTWRGRTRGAGPAPSQPAHGGSDFSQWEAYVREFIQKYQLDDGQTERALSYLKDAQEAARRIIQRTKSEIEQLDKKLAGLGESKDADKLKEMTEINARRTKLLEPINDIFEKQLKPRLEKLPTQKQRQAADEAGKRGPANQATPGSPSRPGPHRQPPRPQPQPPQPEPTPPPQDTGP
jgi:hypothetical protein